MAQTQRFRLRIVRPVVMGGFSAAITLTALCLPLNAAPQETDSPATDSVAQDSDSLSAREIVRDYQQRYQEFVERFREIDDPDQRVDLAETATREINELLAPYLNQPVIREVLPELIETQIIDLKPAFVEVIRSHEDMPTRALALYSMARYFGKNGQDELCMMTLEQLNKSFGDLEYEGLTYAEHVSELTYFFENLAVGREAPSVVGTDVDDVLFRLSDYRGKVVMLRFWGHWCPACRAMYPYERELVRQYSDQPFALIGVNSDSRETCRGAQDSDSLTWRSFWDGGDSNGPIAKTFAIERWPTIVVIDAEGIIRYRSRGLTEEHLNTVIARLVDEANHKLDP